MILQMFTVKDAAAGAYLQPFFEPAKGSALRAFMDASGDPSHTFAKHPSDYTLFHIGSYDDSTCMFDLLDTPLAMCKASDIPQQPEQE